MKKYLHILKTKYDNFCKSIKKWKTWRFQPILLIDYSFKNTVFFEKDFNIVTKDSGGTIVHFLKQLKKFRSDTRKNIMKCLMITREKLAKKMEIEGNE